MSAPSERSLAIVIPALNEEDAIGSTIERCLAARDHICREADLDRVEILAVSDGSTDRTEEIMQSFPEVTVLTFVKKPRLRRRDPMWLPARQQ